MNEFNLLIRGKEVDFVCLCCLFSLDLSRSFQRPKTRVTAAADFEHDYMFTQDLSLSLLFTAMYQFHG